MTTDGPRPVARRLEGKVALVFGAGSLGPGWGIGKAMSVLFARHGAHVAAVDVNLAAAEETAGIIAAEHGSAMALQADVSAAEDTARVVERVAATFGRLDVLVNNVGIGRIGGPVELPEADWDRIAAVNLKGPFLACKHAVPHMLRQGGGAIISTSSVAGLRYVGYPHLAYSTTKAALLQMSRVIALQYAAQNIRANCIVPGLIDTPRIAQTVADAFAPGDFAEARRRRAAQCPMGRMGDAWDVAHAALFLASDEAKYVTAAEIVVDGGLTAKYC